MTKIFFNFFSSIYLLSFVISPSYADQSNSTTYLQNINSEASHSITYLSATIKASYKNEVSEVVHESGHSMTEEIKIHKDQPYSTEEKKLNVTEMVTRLKSLSRNQPIY